MTAPPIVPAQLAPGVLENAATTGRQTAQEAGVVMNPGAELPGAPTVRADPNTGSPTATGTPEVAPATNAIAQESNTFVDEWAKTPNEAGPVRTWRDAADRTGPNGEYLSAWYDTPVNAPDAANPSGLPAHMTEVVQPPPPPPPAPAPAPASGGGGAGTIADYWLLEPGMAGPGAGAGGPGDASGIGSAGSDGAGASGPDGDGTGSDGPGGVGNGSGGTGDGDAPGSANADGDGAGASGGSGGVGDDGVGVGDGTGGVY